MIYLASQSPRRQALLHQMGILHEVLPIEIDEDSSPYFSIEKYVTEMAYCKGESAYHRYCYPLLKTGDFILSADTAIGLDNQIIGKPNSQADFENMMSRLSGQTHQVYSAISLLKVEKNDFKVIQKLNGSEVSFATIPEAFIQKYWMTGEPKDKAGGYAIQGIMAGYIREIKGSYSAIMGLPLYELREAFEELGYNYSLFINQAIY